MTHPQQNFIDFFFGISEEGKAYDAYVEEMNRQATRERRMKLCTHQSGAFRIYKRVDKMVVKEPRYCDICPKCLEDRARRKKAEFRELRKAMKMRYPNRKWHKQVLEKGSNELAALKKKIARNDDGAHMELPHPIDETKKEIWSLVEDKPGKDMIEYCGPEADPDTIDWGAVDRQNTAQGTRTSYGKAMKSRKLVSRKEKSEEEEKELTIYCVTVIGEDDAQAVSDIMFDTNLLQYAHTSEEVQELLTREFELVKWHIEQANQRIAEISEIKYRDTESNIISDWNRGVNQLMSILEPSNGKSVYGSNTDMPTVPTDKFYIAAEIVSQYGWSEAVMDGQVAV